MVAKQIIKSGYRQTEIGIVPEDWDVDEIQNHANITTGAKNTQDKIEDGKFPFFVRSQKIEKINTYSYDGEAVLTAGDGVGTGKVFHYINGKFDFHQRVYSISDFDNSLDGYFFYLYFSSHFLARIMSMTAKSSVDSVRRDMIAEMLIPLPQKKEQIDISTTMKDVTELIETINKTIEKKKNIKQGAMQELLTGKRRLEGFSDKWQGKRLDEECELITKGTTPTSLGKFFTNKGINFIKIETLEENGRIIKDKVAFIDNVTNNLLKRSQLKEKDILISIAGALGRTTIVTVDILPANTNQALAIIRLKTSSKIDYNFLFYYLNSFTIKKHIEAINVQGAQANLSLKNICDLIIPCPSIPEQQKIASILFDIDAEIEALEKKKDKYTMIKNGMMQKLLTGEIRVK